MVLQDLYELVQVTIAADAKATLFGKEQRRSSHNKPDSNYEV